MKKYSAKSIFNLIVYQIGINELYSIPVSKLFHMLYYSDIWYMMITGKYLFKDKFQAGIFSPIHKEILESLSKTIHDKVMYDDLSKDFSIDNYKQDIIDHVDNILDNFMNWPSDALTTKMRSDYPWILAREGYENNERCEVEIDKKVCRVYYRGIDKIIKKCNVVYNRNKDTYEKSLENK